MNEKSYPMNTNFWQVKICGQTYQNFLQKFDQVSANASVSEAWADEKSYPATAEETTE